jgi:putative heme-binding domain-containing protein
MVVVRFRTFCWSLCFILLLNAGFVTEVAGQTLEQRLLQERPAELAASALAEGDAVRGALIFHHSSITCVACHSVGDRPNAIGPDLAKLDPKTSDLALVESVLEPSKVIAPIYTTIAVETTNGLVIRGVLVSETADKVVLRDAAQPLKLIELKPSEIEGRQVEKVSMMPVGQVNLLTDRRQFLDLIRYLMAVRDGGPQRAREIGRSLESLVREFPDKPLPNRPVVQRGEVAVNGGKKYPRGVAIGFAGGTVLFDADQLSTVATWQDGFVKSSPGNYFGVFMHSAGSKPQQFSLEPHPLGFKLTGNESWQSFEPPLISDPNEGTRFDGYQVGRDAVRLHYRVRVGAARISVTEDIHAEQSANWKGFVRDFRFTGLPAGSQVSFKMPHGQQHWLADRDGRRVRPGADLSQAPLLGYQADGQQWVAHTSAQAGTSWTSEGQPGQEEWLLISAAASDQKVMELRLDLWQHVAAKAVIDPAELKELQDKAPVLTESFDSPISAAAPAPSLTEVDEPQSPAVPQRPAVSPKENIDEFPPTTGRFLRFVVNGTNDQSAPGLDELEIYGADPKVNLALQGKASASSVISGFSIHQIPHLNDGKLGNPNSWISNEGNGGWAQIEFPQSVAMQKIVWARDRTGVCTDRLPVKYRIEISTDGKTWSKVGDESGRVSTPGTISRDAAPGYVMESIPLPFAGCRPSDIVFSADGTMYAIAMTEGQIWRTRTPPLGHPSRVNWQRYAAGLYHPIGLAVVGDRLFVAQKPEITELIDRDGDGIVDHFRTLATGWGLSTGWHEYCFGLAVDSQKNLWFALNTGYFWTNPGYVNPGRWRGSVMRVSIETERIEEVAKGCRVPNGVSVGHGGELFFTDNQGDWIQACKLAHIVKGRFYGHPEYKENALPSSQYPDGRSAIWFPYHRMRSISGPVYDSTAGKFGPFADQMFVGDVGYGANAGIMRVAMEIVDGEYQGACFPFVDNQPLGCERMRFGSDNMLYVASLTSGLTRLIYVGHENKNIPLAIQSIHIRPEAKGFVLQLTKPLAAGQMLNPAQFAIKRYHYLYTGNYGSPQSGETAIPVAAAELSADRTAITLSFPVETHPLGMVYEFRTPELRDEQGDKLLQREAWYTVHRIPK